MIALVRYRPKKDWCKLPRESSKSSKAHLLAGVPIRIDLSMAFMAPCGGRMWREIEDELSEAANVIAGVGKTSGPGWLCEHVIEGWRLK